MSARPTEETQALATMFVRARAAAMRHHILTEAGFEEVWLSRLAGLYVAAPGQGAGFRARADAIRGARDFRELCHGYLSKDTPHAP
jgi:hypothetical protein